MGSLHGVDVENVDLAGQDDDGTGVVHLAGDDRDVKIELTEAGRGGCIKNANAARRKRGVAATADDGNEAAGVEHLADCDAASEGKHMAAERAQPDNRKSSGMAGGDAAAVLVEGDGEEVAVPGGSGTAREVSVGQAHRGGRRRDGGARLGDPSVPMIKRLCATVLAEISLPLHLADRGLHLTM